MYIYKLFLFFKIDNFDKIRKMRFTYIYNCNGCFPSLLKIIYKSKNKKEESNLEEKKKERKNRKKKRKLKKRKN